MSGPRYVTLRDYLRVLRGNRWLILLVAVVFTAAAYLITSSQDKKYKAETAVSVRDVTQDLDFLDPAPVRQTPAELTSVAIEDVESPELARGVRKRLDLNSTVKSIDNAISAQPEAITNFINIQAKARSPELAARLANAAAQEIKASRARETKDRLRRLAQSLRREYRDSVSRRTDIFQRAAFEERVARIDAVREIADPVEIVRRAEVPENADSPKVIRNTLLGLLIGLTLGIVAAFVRDSLDVKLRGSDQMSEQLGGVPVLGQISDSALGKGVTEANGAKGLSAADADAFHIVRANLSFLDSERPPRSVAVTSALAEEGKSTVAAALAWSYATSGQRALLLECDLRRPSLAGRLGLKTEPGLSDYLAGKASSQEIIQSPELLADGPRGNGKSGNGQPEAQSGLPTPHLDVVVAGAPVAGPAQLLGSPAFRDFLAVISRSYDITILDCTPLLSVVDTLELLAQVDAVLLCVRAGRTTRDQARAARGALDRFPPKPTGVVVTGARRLGKTDYGYYYASQGSERS